MFFTQNFDSSTIPQKISTFLGTTDSWPIDLGNQFKYCQHCGCYHQGTCPRIKSIEYYLNGSIKKIEYHSPPYSVNIAIDL